MTLEFRTGPTTLDALPRLFDGRNRAEFEGAKRPDSLSDRNNPLGARQARSPAPGGRQP